MRVLRITDPLLRVRFRKAPSDDARCGIFEKIRESACRVVERRSEHPLAIAVVEAAKEKKLSTTLDVVDFRAVAGFGIDARLSNGDHVLIGSEKYLNERGIDTTTMSQHVDEAIGKGSGYFFAAINRQLAALIVVSDPMKPSTPLAVARLIKSNFEVALI